MRTRIGQSKFVIVVLLLLFLSSALPAVVGAQSELQCDPVQGSEICIEEITLSRTTVKAGERINLGITVRNVGDETGGATVLIGFKQPEEEYEYYRAEEIYNLEPGNTQTVTIPMRGESPGVHELNIMLFDQSQQHLYDATGYYQKIVVEKDRLNLVKWFERLGTVAQSILAVIALMIFVLTGRFVWG